MDKRLNKLHSNATRNNDLIRDFLFEFEDDTGVEVVDVDKLKLKLKDEIIDEDYERHLYDLAVEIVHTANDHDKMLIY